jgi:5-(carboxyamino)imidazole ribonucleotide synthase
MPNRTTVGILGAGQLGRMLALAGHNLGLRCVCFDSAPGPASEVCEQIVGRFDDEPALRDFARRCNVVTYEWENVPVAAATLCAQQAPALTLPPVHALAIAQDRLSEKSLFLELGIPVGPFAPARTLAELHDATARIGLPAIIKTRRGGYDGKGQAIVRTAADADHAFAELGAHPGGLIVEAVVDFTRELSVLVCRRATPIAASNELGDVRCYPLTHNVHAGGILRSAVAPAMSVDPALEALASDYATRLVNHLSYAGVLALELFETPAGLLASEIAPRVHNSGHWTIDGAVTSQFENHLRAILGWPLGSTQMASPAAGMVNLIGSSPTPEQIMATTDRAKVHLYAKEPRPGRKLGHVNLTGATYAHVLEAIGRVQALPEP